MSIRWIALFAFIAAIAAVAGCAGYFHYHPVTTTEETRAREAGAAAYTGAGLEEPLAPAIAPAPASEELTIKEEELIK